MKKLIECADDGLESLIGEKITLYCTRYIYTGVLFAVYNDYVMLKDPYIVYETGSFANKDWENAQKLPKDEWLVMLHSVESFGIMK